MKLRFCPNCPARLDCATRHYAGEQIDCAAVKAAHAPHDAIPDDPPLELAEAAAIVLRHWDLHGERGFEAAITLLRRVLARY